MLDQAMYSYRSSDLRKSHMKSVLANELAHVKESYWFGVPVYVKLTLSEVVSIPGCHAVDPGSIPGRGEYFFSSTL